ncbi:Cell surface proteoglycan [Tyrophagus putrescentiae]|nr:Cell surface proteoglycan [Tyrophagus putrescentiae]
MSPKSFFIKPSFPFDQRSSPWPAQQWFTGQPEQQQQHNHNRASPGNIYFSDNPFGEGKLKSSGGGNSPSSPSSSKDPFASVEGSGSGSSSSNNGGSSNSPSEDDEDDEPDDIEGSGDGKGRRSNRRFDSSSSRRPALPPSDDEDDDDFTEGSGDKPRKESADDVEGSGDKPREAVESISSSTSSTTTSTSSPSTTAGFEFASSTPMVTTSSSTTSTSKTTTTPDEPDYIEPEPDDPLDQVENDPEGRYQRPHHPSTGQPPEIVDGKSYPSQYPPFIARPGILAAIIGGTVVGLLCAIILVMFIVYRMRKKDEGSYPLDEARPFRGGGSGKVKKECRYA